MENKKKAKNQFSDVEFQEVEILADGKYNGMIESITRDRENFDYTRYKVKLEDKDFTLQFSFPTNVSLVEGKPSSQHAKFLFKMGIKSFNEIENLLGKKITFMVSQIEKTNGTYAEILKDTIKLI